SHMATRCRRCRPVRSPPGPTRPAPRGAHNAPEEPLAGRARSLYPTSSIARRSGPAAIGWAGLRKPEVEHVTTAQRDGGSGDGPTVRRILLGNQLRELREAKGISREVAAEAIRASDSKISRMELGRVGFKERDVADLLTLYGVVDEQQRDALLALAQGANIPRLVAPLQRHPGQLVPVVPGAGGGGRGGTHLRGAVRPRPAADPRLRPRGHHAVLYRRLD